MGAARRKPKVATLHPIGVAEDGLAVLLSSRANAKTPAYSLAIDGHLLEHLKEAKRLVSRPPEPPPAPPPPPTPETEPDAVALRVVPRAVASGSKLSIREIQALLRQGLSVASVAKRAGVDEAWIERFEGPVVWERAGMATRAQRAALSRPRSGRSALPLGEAVIANLKRRGVDVKGIGAESWDSVRRPRKGTWVVSFTFPQRGRTTVAKWEFDPDSLELSALNASAAQLGWVQARRRRR